MNRIGVVTTSRADYGIYRPVLRALGEGTRLFVSGAHLTTGSMAEIEFPIAEQIPMQLAGDTPEAAAASLGLAVYGFAQAFTRTPVDLLVLLGDRFEMLAAACAALPLSLPLAHIHGGELTYGAFDDNARHAITKLSHLHFASTEEYAARIRQMGEEPWRVHVSGAPALDNLRAMTLLDRAQFADRYGIDLGPDCLLATFHPVTRELEELPQQLEELLAALEGHPVLFTRANADPGGGAINRRLEEYVKAGERRWLVENLGTQGYFSAMRLCRAMVGNSSSGILEAPSLGCPVVNVGTRQDGRVRAGNVIDVEYRREAIKDGLGRARRQSWDNPYGDGRAAERIVEVLQRPWERERLLRKLFLE